MKCQGFWQHRARSYPWSRMVCQGQKKNAAHFRFSGTRGVSGSQPLSQLVALILRSTVLCGVWACLGASQLPFSLQVIGQCRSCRGFCQVVNSTNENLEVFLIWNKSFIFSSRNTNPCPVFKETITTKRPTFQSHLWLSLAGLICSSAAKRVHAPVKVDPLTVTEAFISSHPHQCPAT